MRGAGRIQRQGLHEHDIPESSDIDHLACDADSVAIGFFWSAMDNVIPTLPPYYGTWGTRQVKRSGSPVANPSEVMPLCAPIEFTEPDLVRDGTFSRSCLKKRCTGNGATRDANSSSECVSLCALENSCTAAEYSPSGQCTLWSSACGDAEQPHGVRSRSDLPKPIESESGSTLYTNVEYEHPVAIDGLREFVVSSVQSSFFTKLKFVRWKSSPFTSCSKSCGGGVRIRRVWCSHEDERGTNITLPDDHCTHAEKPTEKEFCNHFHCDAQCRQDSGRMACAGYESDDRRGSTSPEVRALVCEDHGCCFVPRPDGVIMTDFREREC